MSADELADKFAQEMLVNLRHNVSAKREREQQKCPTCGGSGEADSGGIQPWGAPIFIRCHCTYCWCRKCNPSAWWMVLCPDCGNKRCPRASSHENACTKSNEPGQPGSVY